MRAASLPLILVALLAGAPASRAADADAGERVYKTQCATCHSAAAGRNLVGPSLFGIVGRHAGAVAGFRYSAANKAATETWDAPTLDKYLVDPRAVVPGTRMIFVGLKKDEDRANVIAYLNTLK